jgi:sugar (pentulose or hexulose) kinase
MSERHGGLLLGVDVGTSSTKGVLARPDGEVVGEPMLGVATPPSAGAGVGTHRS